MKINGRFRSPVENLYALITSSVILDIFVDPPSPTLLHIPGLLLPLLLLLTRLYLLCIQIKASERTTKKREISQQEERRFRVGLRPDKEEKVVLVCRVFWWEELAMMADDRCHLQVQLGRACSKVYISGLVPETSPKPSGFTKILMRSSYYRQNSKTWL